MVTGETMSLVGLGLSMMSENGCNGVDDGVITVLMTVLLMTVLYFDCVMTL